jgi:glycolate oxidase subunit GlcD
MSSALARSLQRLVPLGRVLTAPAQLAGYDADGLGYKTFRPDAVVIPASIEELTLLLENVSTWGVPVTLRGAGTSLSGGPVAAQGGVVIHTSRLKKVRAISAPGLWCEVECSVVLNQLDAALQPFGLFYPPDPSSGPVCTLGGNVAMNAGGAHCFRYGVTSHYVLGLEAITLDGQVHQFGGPAGGQGEWSADWKRLMVGSEGTLAAFTRFWLRLLPRPQKCWTFRATFNSLPAAERAIQALAMHSSFPVAIELMDPRCVAMVENSPMAAGLPRDAFLLVSEIDGPAALVDSRAAEVADVLRQAGAGSVEFSDDEQVRRALWKARKVAGGLMGQISPDFLVQDAVIPKRALAELLQLVYDEADAAGLPVVNVFHAGDGNLHPNFLFDARRPGDIEKVEAISHRFMERVVEVGGTLSGEHGIGNDKTAYMDLVFSPAAMRLQLAVAQAFNAGHQLNPLKVFATRRFHPAGQLNPAVQPNGESGGSSSRLSVSNRAAALNAPAAINTTTKDVIADSHATGQQKAAVHADVGPGSSTSPPKPPASPTSERLFEPFLDEIDGTACVPAVWSAAEANSFWAARRLRFPLWLDRKASLAEQVASTGWAPASSRFGAFCDNILGMNWQLPSGRVIRIGERVVKSTTGYDLLRFLLQAPSGRFGQPTHFVLRLRPESGVTTQFYLQGSWLQMHEVAARLRTSCWIHWFDSVDVVIDGDDRSEAETVARPHSNRSDVGDDGNHRCRLRIAVHAPEAEWDHYAQAVQQLADLGGLTVRTERAAGPPCDGCPDLVWKTTPDRVLRLAQELMCSQGQFAVGGQQSSPLHDTAADKEHRGGASTWPAPLRWGQLVVNVNLGVIHGYFTRPLPDGLALRSCSDSLAQEWTPRLADIGGEFHSRHASPRVIKSAEAPWLRTLEREFFAL